MRKSIDQSFDRFIQARTDEYVIENLAYQKAFEEMETSYEELFQELPEDLQKKLIIYREKNTYEMSLAIESYYREGFKDAVKLLMRSLT